jgi:hypothetical protein
MSAAAQRIPSVAIPLSQEDKASAMTLHRNRPSLLLAMDQPWRMGSIQPPDEMLCMLASGPVANLSGGGISVGAIFGLGRPVCTSAPTLSSSGDLANPHPGDILTASHGAWIRNPSFNYQFISSVSGIVGSSNPYTIKVGDIGASLKANVIATNSNGTSSAMSASTGTVT